ncbi:MAG TPA: response regulator [Candidatus Competibacteraceae bacterium]|nr:response regulator [Candidatus Competibacteraceae bacterium]
MTESGSAALVYLIDDDAAFREALALLLTSVGLQVRGYADAASFFADYRGDEEVGCLLLDLRLPGPLDGLGIQHELVQRGIGLPVIILSGHGDVQQAVRALRQGALDFLQKPCNDQQLLDKVHQCLVLDRTRRARVARRAELERRYSTLTPREREVMHWVVRGTSNKDIAVKLGISSKTVELHRANVMEKMAASSLSALIKMALEIGLLAGFAEDPGV